MSSATSIVPVILAGGIGERFWPASRSSCPKQLLPLASKKLMIVETFERIIPLCRGMSVDSEKHKVRPLIVTSEKIAEQITASCAGLYEFDVIAEPVGKNTAPAVAAAAAFVSLKYGGNSVLVVVSADNYIAPLEKFTQITLFGTEIASKNDTLVIYGIKPTRPEVGYGYIEKGDSFEIGPNGEKSFKVSRFVEKPNRETAQKYLESGNFYWNSGMFIWRADYILKQIETYIPALFDDTQILLKNNCSIEAIKEFYHKCPKESIDFGVMEHAKDVTALEGAFEWDDIGSWESLERINPKDENNNTVSGDHIFACENLNTIVANRGSGNVAVIGAENMLVVTVEDTTLVISRDKLPDLKNYMAQMKKTMPENLF